MVDPHRVWTWQRAGGAGTSNDIDAWRGELAECAQGGGWQMQELGPVLGHSLPLLRSRRGGAGAPRLLIASGFHGEEPAGPWGVIEFMRTLPEALAGQVDLSLLPLVNATGFAAGTRFNAQGENPNRGYGIHANGDLPSIEGSRVAALSTCRRTGRASRAPAHPALLPARPVESRGTRCDTVVRSPRRGRRGWRHDHGARREQCPAQDPPRRHRRPRKGPAVQRALEAVPQAHGDGQERPHRVGRAGSLRPARRQGLGHPGRDQLHPGALPEDAGCRPRATHGRPRLALPRQAARRGGQPRVRVRRDGGPRQARRTLERARPDCSLGLAAWARRGPGPEATCRPSQAVAGQ